ncbi:MAG: HAD-IIB family hydrolase [Sarcina sp.]
MKKVLVSDVDHTIYFLDERDRKNSKAIKEFRKDNTLIACSGRGMNGIIETEQEMDIEFDHYILLNGAFIADKDKNVLKHEKINTECLKGILKILNKDCLGVCINDGYDYHLVQGSHDSLKLKNIDLFLDKTVSALAVAYRKKDNKFDDILIDCVDTINNKYGEYVTAYKNTKYIDIVPVGCSKGQAVNDLEMEWQLNHKDIFTIGDSENDITMLNNKYVSFTFNSSKDFLKEMVNHVIDEFPECLEIIKKA